MALLYVGFFPHGIFRDVMFTDHSLPTVYDFINKGNSPDKQTDTRRSEFQKLSSYIVVHCHIFHTR